MAGGIVGINRFRENQALGGMASAANLQGTREATGKQLAEAEDATKKGTIMSGAGYGGMAGSMGMFSGLMPSAATTAGGNVLAGTGSAVLDSAMGLGASSQLAGITAGTAGATGAGAAGAGAAGAAGAGAAGAAGAGAAGAAGAGAAGAAGAGAAGAAGAAGTGAVVGAEAGSVVPVVGTVIGAAVGALAGWLMSEFA